MQFPLALMNTVNKNQSALFIFCIIWIKHDFLSINTCYVELYFIVRKAYLLLLVLSKGHWRGTDLFTNSIKLSGQGSG